MVWQKFNSACQNFKSKNGSYNLGWVKNKLVTGNDDLVNGFWYEIKTKTSEVSILRKSLS
jgi:hypothetical protein